MGFTKEFKEFALKGNVMDLAVGVIIGAAFQKIVDSVVNDLIMPIISLLLPAGGFENAFLVLKKGEKYIDGMTLADAKASGATILAWGNFVTILLNFMILAFVVFMLVKSINKLRKETPAA